MKIEVLVATMDQIDYSLPTKLNLQCDAIIANQCERNSIEDIKWNGYNIKYLNFRERGVGLNRNNALMRANADVCLFADDDIRYVANYPNLVEEAFRDNPHSDVLIFNILGRKLNTKKKKVNWFNYLRYGTVRIGVKLKSIRENAIYFNQCFGGGTEHSHGEDSLFLTDCLKKKLKITAVPITIAEIKNERASTWRTNDTKKYLKDQGILYKTISKRWWLFLCMQDAIRRYKQYKMYPIDCYKIMVEGNDE